MRITSSQAADLATTVAAESARHGFPRRRPWMQPGIRTLLTELDTPSYADLAWAALAAAANSEHETPAGIRHELERLKARRTQAAHNRCETHNEDTPAKADWLALIAACHGDEHEARRRIIDHGVATGRLPGNPNVIHECLTAAQQEPTQ